MRGKIAFISNNSRPNTQENLYLVDDVELIDNVSQYP